MQKDVIIAETARGFSIKQGGKSYPPTTVPLELAAVLELLGAEHVSWRVLRDTEDPAVLEEVSETVRAVGSCRQRLRRLLTSDSRATCA